jgi:mono/diheme cytochrome c family protein
MSRLLLPLAGLAALLWAAPSRADDTSAPVAAAADSGPMSTKDLYHAKCAGCHGDDGKGQTKWGKKYKAPDFTSAKFQNESKDSEFLETIQKGVVKKVKDDKTGEVKPKKIMPGWSEKLTADQMNDLVAYVRTFKPQG